MTVESNNYRRLDEAKVLETLRILRNRIEERFPDSGLGRVAQSMLEMGRDVTSVARRIQRPNWFLRGLNILLLVGLVALLYWLMTHIRELGIDIVDVEDFILFAEPLLGVLVFVGAFILFIWTLESRMKRRRAIDKIYELRSMAHIIDMHQLRKDPERISRHLPDTPSSPKIVMTAEGLNRYLDYCSELLSILGKIAAIFSEHFTDPAVLVGVDEVESLATGLSRKIWQKIIIVSRIDPTS